MCLPPLLKAVTINNYYFFTDVARFLVSVAESGGSGEWHRVAVAVTTKYSPEEEAKGFQRLQAQMEKNINK